MNTSANVRGLHVACADPSFRRPILRVAALGALCLWASAGSARAQSTPDHESIVRQAMARYEAERAAGTDPQPGTPQGGTPIGGTRELRLADAVELALSQNLDIAVERLTPQATDFQLAGLKSGYRPLASSNIGQRSQVNPPTNQLNGGQRVTNDTTTYNFGVSQSVPWGGGAFSVTTLVKSAESDSAARRRSHSERGCRPPISGAKPNSPSKGSLSRYTRATAGTPSTMPMPTSANSASAPRIQRESIGSLASSHECRKPAKIIASAGYAGMM